MLYGITDIGSNTIRVKIYEKKNDKIKTLISKKRTAGLISYREDGKLNQDGIDVLISTIKRFKRYMDIFNVDVRCFFSTASLRNISNTQEVLDQVYESTGIKIRLLTPTEEALWSYKAVLRDNLENDDGVLIDVGGGSSEIAVFTDRLAIDNTSLPVGSLICYKEYVSKMFPTKKEKKEIINCVGEELKKSGIMQCDMEYLYTVGGTARTIKKMLEQLDIKEDKSSVFNINLLNKLLKELKHNTQEDYMKLLKVNADRIHTLVPGILIIKTIGNYYNCDKIHVSMDSIREGVLYTIIDGEI